MTNRACLALFAAFALAGLAPATAQEAETPQAVLFVVSSPMGATVVMDGELLEGRTPLLLRRVSPGRHVLLISTEGLPPQLAAVEIGAGEVRELRVDLAAAFVRLAFPEEDTVRAGGVEHSAARQLFQLPQGSYRLQREDGILALEREYRGEGWIRGLSLSLPLCLAFSAVLTAHDAYYPKRLAVDLGPDLSLSPATLTAYGVTLAAGAVDLALLARRARLRRSFSCTLVPAERSLAAAAELYAQAEDYLSRGQLQEALRSYAAVMSGFPDSLLFAQALFKSARIHSLSGQDDLAVVEYTLLAERYPLPELYDKARRGLADLLLRRRAYEQALEQLSAMVFLDPQYAREEVELFAAEALESWFASEPPVLARVVEAYRALAERYPGSDGLGLYLYRLAYYLHLAERDGEAAAALNRIPLQRQEAGLRERIEALRRALAEGA